MPPGRDDLDFGYFEILKIRCNSNKGGMNMKTILLENEHVLLRPVTRDDVLQIRAAANDARIWTHMSVELLSDQAVEKYIEEALHGYETGASYLFVVIDKKAKRIVGCTSFLDISIPHKRLEIGATWYHPSVWRTHINTNCKYVLLSYCFDELLLNRVQIKTGHENIRSQQAIERLGATKEGILRNHMVQRNGKLRHTVMYSIISGEWLRIKNRFEKNLM